MGKISENNVLENVCGKVRAERRILKAHLSKLQGTFGRRLEKAMEALKDRRIKKYIFQPSGRIIWIVVGRTRDYLVMPSINYCSCADFYYQFDHGHICYHIVAQRLADATEQFDLFQEDDRFFDVLIQEWKEPEERTAKKKRAKRE